MTVLIDVVIPTKDRPEALRACLEALAQQTQRAVNIIVVDDGSIVPAADGLPPELLARLRITVLRHPVSRGPAAARNRAIRHGQAPYIAFIDDDVRCEPDLLERQLERLREGSDRDVIIGPLATPPDWDPTPWNLWEARQVDVEYGRMSRGEYTPTWRQFHTGNAFLARRTIEDAGPFDERFTRAEDVEFALRASLRGHRFVFNADAIGWHYSYRTREAWLRIPRAYADFDVLLARMHPDLNWLRTIARERRQRHPVLRLARVVSRIPRVRPSMVGALTSGAELLYRPARGFRQRLAMALLSIAYDVEYEAAHVRSQAAAGTSFAAYEAAAAPTEGM